MNLKDYISLYSVETLIKKKQFIPMKTFSSEWQGTDSKELYLENLQKQPLDWYYRNNRVKYTLNSKGYRTEEFKKIDWAESVVMFGCSMVYGTGVTDEDTISHNLSKIIDRPVINMGVGGSSISFSLHNSLILNSFYPTPKAILKWFTDDRIVWDEIIILMSIAYLKNFYNIRIAPSVGYSDCYLEYSFKEYNTPVFSETFNLLKQDNLLLGRYSMDHYAQQEGDYLLWGHPSERVHNIYAEYLFEELTNVQV